MNSKEYLLSRKLVMLANTITKGRNGRIKHLGLTAVQAEAMMFFKNNKNKSAIDLKNHLGITHQTARGIVERMVSKGFLKLEVSKSDARRKIVTVTQKCSALCDRLSQNGLIVGDRLFAGMTDSEKQCFSELVTKALCNLSKAENI